MDQAAFLQVECGIRNGAVAYLDLEAVISRIEGDRLSAVGRETVGCISIEGEFCGCAAGIVQDQIAFTSHEEDSQEEEDEGFQGGKKILCWS